MLEKICGGQPNTIELLIDLLGPNENHSIYLLE